MARRIRWLGVGMLLCFVVLFVQLDKIQVVKAHQYAIDPHNPVQIEQRFDQPRGIIESADGQTRAKSVPAPAGSTLKYERVTDSPTITDTVTLTVSTRRQEVAKSAPGVGFLPQDDVAAKTGMARAGTGNSSVSAWMSAFAPAGHPVIAVATTTARLDQLGAEVAGSIVKAMIEAAPNA